MSCEPKKDDLGLWVIDINKSTSLWEYAERDRIAVDIGNSGHIDYEQIPSIIKFLENCYLEKFNKSAIKELERTADVGLHTERAIQA